MGHFGDHFGGHYDTGKPDMVDYLIEKYKDLAQMLTKKYQYYKKLQSEGKTPASILEIMHNEIESIEKELTETRKKITELRANLK